MTLLGACLAKGQTSAESAHDLITGLREAQAAVRFEDRLRTHERALDAILKADDPKLEAALALWCQDEDRDRRNGFVRMAWTRLAQLDTGRALQLIDGARGEAFFEASREVWAEIARKEPERAYTAAQKLAPASKEQHQSKWLVQHIMRAVGASWFRATGLATLKRLPMLSHPDLMATAVFHGCVAEAHTAEAHTAEDKLALLDRYAGDEKPMIEENHIKSPNLCDELVRAAALADLPATRAWIERRFPAGTKRLSGRERDWHLVHARNELFRVWSRANPAAATDWLMSQQHADEDSDTSYAMTIAAFAIAGADREDMAAALAWLGKQKRPQDRTATLADFLDDDFGEDAVLRQSRDVLARWLATRPMAEREAVVLQCAKDYVRVQAKGDFLAVVFPEPAKCREMTEQLEKITGPAPDPEIVSGDSFMLRVFDLPIRDKTLAVSEAEARRSRELSRLHELARTATDPARRREGLEALKWMKSATPAELRSVLLPYLKDHRMDWFAEDLLSAWVLQDWRSCEAFAMGAHLPVAQRNDMLVHIFCEVAELHPDAALPRLRELIQAKVLVQAALDSPDDFGQVGWWTYYYGDMITRSLARGLLRQGDMQALAIIQTLPPSWQNTPFEVLYQGFTTPACGKQLLAYMEFADLAEKQRHNGVFRDFTVDLPQVIERMASISQAEAVQWLEERPERFSDFEKGERDNLVWRIHEAWRRNDPKAADAWIERVRREHPRRKAETPALMAPSDSRPLLPAVPPRSVELVK
ncbi:MAG: hypothetical protein NTY98_11720 [Verrucomicrobia bacterium]|nr:hypothetical protein [Verrucomicrobiota bacterium]